MSDVTLPKLATTKKKVLFQLVVFENVVANRKLRVSDRAQIIKCFSCLLGFEWTDSHRIISIFAMARILV